jgi:uncharacterized protein (TIGR03435 family)
VLLIAFPAAAETPPAFDVASIRASQIGRAGGEGSRRESTQVSPGSVIMRNVSLKSCIRFAYHVMDYQVSGPDWLNTERYDITAKAAGPADEDQIRLMMQTLLAERFKLALHRQTKELPAYVLLVGKNGPKFKESQSEGESSIQPQQKMLSVAVQRARVSQLVDMLSNFLRTPVLDMTGLTGRYDITISVEKYLGDFEGVAKAGGDPLTAMASIIMTAVQEELGLKLESKKAPLELLIIDHAERAPADN